jgi:single-strand DNA-binding protein
MFLNEAQISLTGYVATQPVTKIVKSGASNLSMRVAWTPRRQDRVSGEWVDGNTSYVTVICWRKLATNAGLCVRKGDPVVVKGRLSIRPYQDKQGVQRIAVEIEANAVGHDLSRGVALFQRVRPQTGLTASEFLAVSGGQSQGEGDLDGTRTESAGQPTSELAASNATSSGDDAEAVLGLSDFPASEGPGVADPFFDDSSSEDHAADREPVTAPF